MFGRFVKLGTLSMLLIAVMVLMGITASAVQAGGWTKIDYTKSHDPNDTLGNTGEGADIAIWNPHETSDSVGVDEWDQYNSPHGGYSTSTNRCRVCHAVHEASPTSWRLLNNGDTATTRTAGERVGENGMGNKRSTECMFCHDATSGVTEKRPYKLGGFGSMVRGEHTLGSDWVPDNSANDPTTDTNNKSTLVRGGVLDCFQCHSVHGAEIVKDIPAWGAGKYDEKIDKYILRNDPAGNSGNANDGIDSIKTPPGGWKGPGGGPKGDPDYPATDTVDPYAEWKYEVMAAWCGDCHNMNPNITNPTDVRPNSTSHPIFGGPEVESSETTGQGWMQVNESTIQVSGGAPKGCDGCHKSGQGSGGTSTWPHQSAGAKFLVVDKAGGPMDEGTSVAGTTGDSWRIIPNMDKACVWCHRWKPLSSTTEGVGITF